MIFVANVSKFCNAFICDLESHQLNNRPSHVQKRIKDLGTKDLIGLNAVICMIVDLSPSNEMGEALRP